MRILMVGNFRERRWGDYFYTTVRKMMNGFIRNGHFTYCFSDRDIARSITLMRSRTFGSRATNRAFLETCRNLAPHVIYLHFADILTPKTLEKAKKMLPETRLINIFLDNVVFPRNIERLHRYADVVDHTFVTTAGSVLRQFARHGTAVSFVPNPVDSCVETLEAFSNSQPDYDVFFSIGNPRSTPERVKVAKKLRENLPQGRFAYFGVDMPNTGLWNINYFNTIARTRLGLNISNSQDHPLYSSDRISQYMGNGLLACIDTRAKYQNYFSEKEVLFFDGVEELTDKVAYYISHDTQARRVAKAGHKHIHATHNVETVTKYLLEKAFDKKPSQVYDWPSESHVV